MYISRLRLTNFRNYEFQELVFDRERVFIRGDNAQGKTNLLESMFLCAAGRSHRTSKEKDMVRMGCDNAGVKMMIKRIEGTQTIDYRLYSNKNRDIYINGIKTRRIGELMGHFNCVFFAPEDLDLVKDGPAMRRRFMDIELSQLYPAYFYALQRYNHILKQRNNLLKSIEFKPSLRGTLPVWNEQLAMSGANIMKTRVAFCEKLCALAEENHGAISGGREKMQAEYTPNMPLEAVEYGAYAELLAKSENDDIRRRTTLLGVHRDDISISVDGADIRGYGSQGQQRTAAISLKLSELTLMKEVLGQSPVLLLDDVLSELDDNRRGMLLKSIKNIQAFISGTNCDDVGIKDIKRLSVKDGRVVFEN